MSADLLEVYLVALHGEQWVLTTPVDKLVYIGTARNLCVNLYTHLAAVPRKLGRRSLAGSPLLVISPPPSRCRSSVDIVINATAMNYHRARDALSRNPQLSDRLLNLNGIVFNYRRTRCCHAY